MIAVCLWKVLSIGELILTPLVLAAAWQCIRYARRFRHLSAQADNVMQRSALITSRVLDRASPFLDCEHCGARLDPRIGIAASVTDTDQLQLLCSTCAAEEKRDA